MIEAESIDATVERPLPLFGPLEAAALATAFVLVNCAAINARQFENLHTYLVGLLVVVESITLVGTTVWAIGLGFRGWYLLSRQQKVSAMATVFSVVVCVAAVGWALWGGAPTLIPS